MIASSPHATEVGNSLKSEAEDLLSCVMGGKKENLINWFSLNCVTNK